MMLQGTLYLPPFSCIWGVWLKNGYFYGGQGRMASVIRDASFLEFLIEIRIGLSNGLIRVPFLGTWNFCNHKGFPMACQIFSRLGTLLMHLQNAT